MTLFAIFKLPLRTFRRHAILVSMVVLIILSATFYPSDLEGDYATTKGGHDSALVMTTEVYGRHVNTLLPIVVAVVMRDWVGLKQLGVIIVAGTLASHGPKRLLNDVEIMGTRLGQRPSSPTSKHNMPSGHSTLSSAGAYFLMRRYSVWFGLVAVPVLLLTMYGRYMLDKHTVSATIAGALTGILITALFTTKFRGFHSRMRAIFSRK